jgi:hypothetical protein
MTERIKALEAALRALEAAAFRRDNVMGDLPGLLQAKADLAAAAEKARKVLAEGIGK